MSHIRPAGLSTSSLDARSKEVVIFIGPPGAGKGTQALWLEHELGFFHLESTAVIRKNFSEHPDDPAVIIQKANIAKGDLVDPPIILEWMKKDIVQKHEEGKSIVFSGSPRTVFEAIGDEKTEGMVGQLGGLYGPQNVHVFDLQVSEETSVLRNSVRRVCVAQNHPIPNTDEYRALTLCPWDGSPLQRRPDKLDDDEKLIRERYQIYLRRTQPLLAAIGELGYSVVVLDGDNTIEYVHHLVVDVIERRRMPAPTQ